MKLRLDKRYFGAGLTAFLVIVSSILFFLILNRMDVVVICLNFIIGLLMPFILGLVMAYLLWPLVGFFEKKCFIPLFSKYRRRCQQKGKVPKPRTGFRERLGRNEKLDEMLNRVGYKKPEKPKEPVRDKVSRAPRGIAIFVTLILALSLVIGLIVLVLPQLLDSVRKLIEDLPGYFKQLENWTIDMVASNKEIQSLLTKQFDNINDVVTGWAKNNLLPEINSILSGVTTGVIGAVSALMNFFVGLIVSIYIMFSKERFFAQTKKFSYAFLSIKGTNTLLRVARRADKMFGSFIKGKLIDSFIIGCICFVCLSILNISTFPLLIAVLIGVSNVIPFFGPIIGAVPSALLVLLSDIQHPMNTVWFVLFILLLQQFDGNILGPKILGDSTGLSAFWVIFSIMIFGGLFGFVGMVIGVPAFGLIYSFVAEFATRRLKKGNLPVATEEYLKIDYISLENKKPVYADMEEAPEYPLGETIVYDRNFDKEEKEKHQDKEK